MAQRKTAKKLPFFLSTDNSYSAPDELMQRPQISNSLPTGCLFVRAQIPHAERACAALSPEGTRCAVARGHVLRCRRDVYTPTGPDVHAHECASVSSSHQPKTGFSSSGAAIIPYRVTICDSTEIRFIVPHLLSRQPGSVRRGVFREDSILWYRYCSTPSHSECHKTVTSASEPLKVSIQC